MDPPDGVGIKIYNASPCALDPSAYPSSSQEPSLDDMPPPPPTAGGRKRRAVANGFQKTLSKTSMLANFLPTGTLLTFGLCMLSCFFFHFTDSFRGPEGKVYYGFVTPKGLAVFKHGLGVEVPKDERYKVGFTDFVHAFMSVLVFVSIAFSDHRVTDCLFPHHAKEMDEVMKSFPLMVGVICITLFLVFPNTRYGIGCSAA